MGTNSKDNQRTEEELRIAKMISEGGLGVEAYYYYRNWGKDRQQENDDKLSNIISIGGLGSKIFRSIK